MANSFVYRWTDTLTGKLYIGVHKGTEYDGYVCSSKPFLKEYNQRPQDFIREIIAWFDEYREARELEIVMLTEVDAQNDPMYYNQSNGNSKSFYSHGPMSEETKNKISKNRKGISTGKRTPEQKQHLSFIRKGVKKTDEHRQKIGNSNKGKTRGKGIPKSIEHRSKISDANKRRVWTEETRQKLAAARKAQTGTKRGKYRARISL